MNSLQEAIPNIRAMAQKIGKADKLIIYYLNINKMKRPLNCLILSALLYVIAMAIEGNYDSSLPMSHNDHGYCRVSMMRFVSGHDAKVQVGTAGGYFISK